MVAGRTRRLALLLALYFSQGLPFGFQVLALPIYLRDRGVSLASIGFSIGLAAPWMFKWLWAPLVDRYGSERFGRRRTWIVPMQLLMAASAVTAGALVGGGSLRGVLAAIFLMNLFAATQDVAVDGLAVDVLRRSELGSGNAIQVAGYKLGMVTGGGLLVWLTGALGWPWVFYGMAALNLAVVTWTLLTPEEGSSAAEERHLWRQIAQHALRAVRRPGAGWLLVFIATYKVGEAMADQMFKPFLVDAGFDRAQLGLWLGTYGMAASITGSVVGGWVVTRLGFLPALALCGVLRAGSVGLKWLLAVFAPPAAGAVIGTSVVENAFGGMLTTALFAFMMSRVDPAIGATHFTVLASVEVVGKSLGSFFSGVLAQRLGYAALFLLGTSLSFAFLALLWPIWRASPASAGAGPPSAPRSPR